MNKDVVIYQSADGLVKIEAMKELFAVVKDYTYALDTLVKVVVKQ